MATQRNILLTPGPTPVPPEVLAIFSKPIFHHRTPQYRKIFNKVSQDLKEIFRTKNNVYTFTSSGTGAMEASILNFLSPGDAIITAHAGKFGERWIELGKCYGMKLVDVSSPYGEAIHPSQIEAALKAHPEVKAVYVTHCETSTGVCHDIEGIGKVVARTNAILVVDAISGLAAEPLEQDEWNVDVVVTGSQKALMLPPGLAFLSASEKAMALYANSKCVKYYYDLKLYKKAIADSDTPFTSALTLVLGLEESLNIIKSKGLDAHFAETERLAKATRASMQAIGLELFAKERLSNGLTSVKMPAGLDGEKLTKIMRDDKGVTLAGGQGDMKGKIFRIAHMGFITKSDLLTGIQILCETLTEMGYACQSKTALDSFNETYNRRGERILK